MKVYIKANSNILPLLRPAFKDYRNTVPNDFNKVKISANCGGVAFQGFTQQPLRFKTIAPTQSGQEP